MTKARASARARRHRPWGDYGLRLLTSALFLGASYVLLAGSTFALRMRNDVPAFVPGLDGPESIALVTSAGLALFPLLLGSRYLAGLLASCFIATGLGAYWWTLVPWDELLTKSQFPTQDPPRLLDYLRVAAPSALVAFYAAMSRASVMRADYRTRGADAREASRAAAASFLSSAAALVVATAMAAGLWVALASGLLRDGIPLTGVPALVLAGLFGALVLLVGSQRLRWSGRRPRFDPASRSSPPS